MWKFTLFHGAIIAITWTLASSAALLRDDYDIDVNKTLENVQEILAANPLLPRLSNEEILNLLNNITAEDKLKNQDKPTKKDEKLMVVLPHKASKPTVDVTELYTKPPIVKIVSTSSNPNSELTTKPSEVQLLNELSEILADVESDSKSEHKKKNKPKKANTIGKNDESKDLLKEVTKLDLPSLDYEFLDKHPIDNSQIADTDVAAFETFKPLPKFESLPSHIKSILDSLDDSIKAESLITETVEKVEKTTPKSNLQYVDLETFPPEMMSILTDLGLTKNEEVQAYPSSSKPRKMFDSRPVESSEQLAAGPDPLDSDEGVDDNLTNELAKRQHGDSTESSEEATTTPEPKTESSDSGKSDEKEGPSISDLENSFGTSDADDDPSEAELPPPRRNGFYYMLDWNSFLEVGDGDRKVNIRFDPKLGDPQRFIAVNVP